MVSTSAISASQEQQYTTADTDGDGYLTEDEFNSQFPSESFGQYDKDGDGKVTKEEYKEAILETNKKFLDMMWTQAMKIFGLDKLENLAIDPWGPEES